MYVSRIFFWSFVSQCLDKPLLMYNRSDTENREKYWMMQMKAGSVSNQTSSSSNNNTSRGHPFPVAKHDLLLSRVPETILCASSEFQMTRKHCQKNSAILTNRLCNLVSNRICCVFVQYCPHELCKTWPGYDLRTRNLLHFDLPIPAFEHAWTLNELITFLQNFVLCNIIYPFLTFS